MRVCDTSLRTIKFPKKKINQTPKKKNAKKNLRTCKKLRCRANRAKNILADFQLKNKTGSQPAAPRFVVVPVDCLWFARS